MEHDRSTISDPCYVCHPDCHCVELTIAGGTVVRRVQPHDKDPFNTPERINDCPIFINHVARVDGLRGITFRDSSDPPESTS